MTKKTKKGPLRGRAGRMRGGRGSGRAGAGDVRLWGRHAVEAALANPLRQPRILRATREAVAQLETAPPEGLPIEHADASDLDRLVSQGATHQGLVLDCRALEEVALEDVLAREGTGPLLVLDQVTDPQNVGAILRSAAAFGAAALVTQDRHSPPESGALAKAASGALESMPWSRVVNLARALDMIGEAGFWRVGLDASASSTLREALPEKARVALVLGAEGDGIRPNVGGRCDAMARLPIEGSVESLNVSNAAAIALYAAATRRSLATE